MFPHSDPIDISALFGLDEELLLSVSEVKDLLTPYLTEERRRRIEEVVGRRTYTVVPVMEGICDLGNAAAVFRSAEGLGFQGAHLIDTQPKHKTSQRVTQGADKWLDVEEWSDTKSCVAELKRRGYAICVTHLEAAIPIEDVDFTKPTALVLGNEMVGVSEEMLDAADVRCIIPIDGFVQSYNISVAAALSLYAARRQRVEALGGQGDLTDGQKEILEAHFYIRAVNQAEKLIPELIKRRK